MNTSSRRFLARAASSLALALTASVLSAGCAHAETPISADTAVGQRDGEAAGAAEVARPAPISVLAVGDHAVFRSGLRAVVESRPDLRYLADTADAAAVPADIRRLRPDVALVDLDSAGLDRVLAAEPEQTFGSTRILTFTDHATDENVYRAVRLGASGFLTKDLGAEQLVSAIRRTAREDALIDPRLTRRLVTRLADGPDPFPQAPAAASLTAREHEVLLLIAAAHTNPEIAALLDIGEQTVKSHVSHILAKLGVRDRVHAAVYAHTRRLVRAPALTGPAAGPTVSGDEV
ncbi:LuxR C-terminal-related transcriptional regulator [Nocardia blacklockiae]|uniref:LuxR C-terminal-related transcriptional regulator n=1 Tax=Nocardia blacklockiae TaxID=480036 RepID=UPI001893B24A|nr:response regulator transcription factor [Nocardia blacklockiae]MBF6170945.1 response regulator transcription factor [Nocardia blacklockiae]